jgi:hypothetical protein
MESLNHQEIYIEQLEDMMNIHIEEDLVSKLVFLHDCKERDKIIEKANKNVTSIKYPAPVTKLRHDKEIETIVKDLKQITRVGKRKASIQNKATTQHAHTTKGPGTHADNFTKTVKHTKSKVVNEKQEMKSPEKMHKKMSENSKTEKVRNSQTFKGSSAKKPMDMMNKKQNEKPLGKQPPKVIQEALNKAKEQEGKDLEFEEVDKKYKKRGSHINPVTTEPKQHKYNYSPEEQQCIKTPQKMNVKGETKPEIQPKVAAGRDRQKYVKN